MEAFNYVFGNILMYVVISAMVYYVFSLHIYNAFNILQRLSAVINAVGLVLLIVSLIFSINALGALCWAVLIGIFIVSSVVTMIDTIMWLVLLK